MKQAKAAYAAYYSTLNMESICSPEMSVDFQRTTRRYITEDRSLHNHRCENLRSHILILQLAEAN
jgi:hypothetical protein